MNSFTSGPWHTGEGKAALIVYGQDGFAIADAKTFHGRIDSNTAKANARLMADAPYMLTGLKELSLRTRQFIAGELVTFPAALLPQIESLIAHAEGGDA